MNISFFSSDCQSVTAQKQQTNLSLQIPTQITSSAIVKSQKLTEEEASERHLLELKIERAFYEAGHALRKLRDRRLYRNTHKTFEDYCQDRFNFTRRHVNYLIAGSQVVDNLRLGTNGSQILPTSERQVRDLTYLEPLQQRFVWEEAVEKAGGKVPSGRLVKSIVQRLQKKDPTPTSSISYSTGDVVMIRSKCETELKKFDGNWAVVVAVNEYTVSVALDKNRVVKPQFLEAVEPERWSDIKAINSRLARLSKCELDPIDKATFDFLRRHTCFTSRQLQVLEHMEKNYLRV